MTAPVRRPLSGNQLATLVFSAVVLLLMLCVPTSREWMWGKFSRASVSTLTNLGADVSPITAGRKAVATFTEPQPIGVGEKHSAFPSMAQTEEGLELVWRQGTDHYAKRDGRIMRAVSHDQGVSWGDVSTIRSGGDYRDPSLSADGTHLTWFTGSTASPALGAWTQTEGWAPTAKLSGTLPYAATTAPAIHLPNGELGAVFYGRQTGETIDTNWMAWSKDDGLHWTTNRITNLIGSGTATNEPYAVVDGSTVHVFYRCGTNAIGMRSTTASGHGGWDTPRKILANATGRPTTIATQDGTLLMVYRHLPDKAAWIATSSDHGATWLDGGLLMAPPAGSPNGMTYASMVETTPGEVLVVFGMESTTTSSVLYSARLSISGGA
jgi:hypothetical protein